MSDQKSFFDGYLGATEGCGTSMPPVQNAANSSAASSPPGQDSGLQAAADPQENLVTLRLEFSGNLVSYKLKVSTKMEKLFKSFYKKNFVQPGTVRFLLDGQRLVESDTPASLNLQEDDIINVYGEQTGGAYDPSELYGANPQKVNWILARESISEIFCQMRQLENMFDELTVFDFCMLPDDRKDEKKIDNLIDVFRDSVDRFLDSLDNSEARYRYPVPEILIDDIKGSDVMDCLKAAQRACGNLKRQAKRVEMATTNGDMKKHMEKLESIAMMGEARMKVARVLLEETRKLFGLYY